MEKREHLRYFDENNFNNSLILHLRNSTQLNQIVGCHGETLNLSIKTHSLAIELAKFTINKYQLTKLWTSFPRTKEGR